MSRAVFYELLEASEPRGQAFAERSEAKVDTNEGAKRQHGCEANFSIAKLWKNSVA